MRNRSLIALALAAIFSGVAIVGCAGSSSRAVAEAAEVDPDIAVPARDAEPENNYCVISGEPVNLSHRVKYKGTTIGFSDGRAERTFLAMSEGERDETLGRVRSLR